ncbi:MAG: WG repeat-containing protein [Flavobacteriales bacterium]|nr:WG repeat-containing protein [Flavobacteriales bacterium]
MKHLLLAIPAVLLSTAMQAQTLLSQARPAESEFWGYVDNTGNMVIPPKYKHCFPFGESGYAAVKDAVTDKPGFINVKGEALRTDPADFVLISGLFGGKDAQGFSCGRAPVRIGDLWGFMGTDGKMAIPAKYDKVEPFEGCFAVVMLGKKQYILTADGKEVPVSDPNIVDVKGFKNGLSPFKQKDKMHGFMDGDQTIVIPAQFLSVGYFTGELAWAKTKEGKVGFINRKGEWVITAQFDAAEDFDEASGMARVKQADAWMYVARDGSIMRMTDTQVWGDFSDGLAKGKKGELFGFFDKSGTWVIQPQFQGVRDFKNGYAAAKQGEKWGFIDTAGKWAVEPKFEVVKDMEKPSK